jgi:hypothetical protein
LVNSVWPRPTCDAQVLLRLRRAMRHASSGARGRVP